MAALAVKPMVHGKWCVKTLSRLKTEFVCQQCGSKQPKWSGQCPDCLNWNCLVEQTLVASKTAPAHAARTGYAGERSGRVFQLGDIPVDERQRASTGLLEFDRVLGGGLTPGSVVLIGGDPGIGKSTLLLQTIAQLSQEYAVLYITGEESLNQVAARAERLELNVEKVSVLSETSVEAILNQVAAQKPRAFVIDSIQTIYTESVPSAPGSVSQIRESTARLVQYAKQHDAAIFLVGHVTKEGQLAGPRVLEHMVDTVLYFEGEAFQRFRMIRAIKNRFGAVNELGVFAMTEKGLREVHNPSAIFLSRYEQAVPGNVVMVTWEGSRPMLVEVQALVDASHLANPRRVAVGVDGNRLSMLLAVLNRHAGIATYDQDVFLNIVGGARVAETAVDLALLFAVASSLRNRPLPLDLIVFGEVGLSGEVRPVMNGVERLREAAKHGFHKAIVPKANLPKEGTVDLEVIGVQRLEEAFRLI